MEGLIKEIMNWGVGSGVGRVEHVERGEGESGGLTDWEILTQRRRVRRGVDRVERVDGDWWGESGGSVAPRRSNEE